MSCFGKKKCSGMSLYVLGNNDCNINYFHSHCYDIIPETRLICNKPIYWWKRKGSNI